MYQLPYTDDHLYPENKTARQFWGRLPCHAAMSLLYFKKGTRTQHIIHHLKYKGRQELGVKLGKMIGEKLKLSPDYSGIDIIVPVPLHPHRERTRGYNQSTCIAEGIAAVLNVPVNTAALKRHNATKSQTKKGRYERFENMKAVFSAADSAALKNMRVLLVDDVMTTGATLEACGTILQACKISRLYIATVAYAE